MSATGINLLAVDIDVEDGGIEVATRPRARSPRRWCRPPRPRRSRVVEHVLEQHADQILILDDEDACRRCRHDPSPLQSSGAWPASAVQTRADHTSGGEHAKIAAEREQHAERRECAGRRPHGVSADAAPARHQRPGGAARDGRGAARATSCERDFTDVGLCRPGAADRLRADHQPALCRRLHDRAARRAAAPPRARDRHRLRLPGRRPVAARARGGQHRALSARSPTARASACAGSATTMSRSSRATDSPARRTRRRSTASSSPPRRRRCRRRWSSSSRTAA